MVRRVIARCTFTSKAKVSKRKKIYVTPQVPLETKKNAAFVRLSLLCTVQQTPTQNSKQRENLKSTELPIMEMATSSNLNDCETLSYLCFKQINCILDRFSKRTIRLYKIKNEETIDRIMTEMASSEFFIAFRDRLWGDEIIGLKIRNSGKIQSITY